MPLDETSEAIGRLRASVEDMRRQQVTHHSESAEGRRILYNKIDHISIKTIDLAGKVQGLNDRINEIAPLVKVHESVRIQQVASRRTLAFVWGGVLSLFAGLGAAATEAARVLFHK